ncbi:hypothetical protein [Sphingobacterium chungjuense]|uniref:hypothetical protein n=1 Tax=Sphingobacterium chungjuense TaxID=2675553 RepID=UPI001409C10D|nr:hypothetical protein [Sphingobacterium chungjuense]
MSLLRTVYVGIGGAGGYIIKSHDNFFRDKLYLYLDGEKDLRHIFDELIGIKRNIYDKQNLSAYFHKENRYELFLGLGGKTGSSCIIEILDFLNSNGIYYKCYCFYPYSFEPNTRISVADKTLVSLKQYQGVTVLYMDEIKKRYTNLNLASVFSIPNEVLVKNYLKNDSV